MAKEAGRNNIIGAQTCSGIGPDRQTDNRDRLLASEQTQQLLQCLPCLRHLQASPLQLRGEQSRAMSLKIESTSLWSQGKPFGFHSTISEHESALK